MNYSWPSAKVIADTVSQRGHRITTMEVKMHRFILPEFNTHRAHSKSSASSRAIPFTKRLEIVLHDPAMPVFWGKNQPGMSARVELSPEEKERAIRAWLDARDNAVKDACRLNDLGVHKQLVNRIIEPFMWHTVVVTATEWDNFYSQRYHPKANQEEIAQAAAEWDAQPEMMAMAYAMKEAHDASVPKKSFYHLPYINDDDYRELNSENNMFKVSTARCGRVSYLNHDGTRDLEKDIALFDKLNTSTPTHFSPMEHCAFDSFNDKKYFNIKGWKSMRYLREAEKISF